MEEHAGRRVVTTERVLAEEERLTDFARAGLGAGRPLGAPDRPIQRDRLNACQRKAVQYVLSSRDRVVLIRGVAGTGKTTLMKEAGEAIEQGGHREVMLAPSATAARDVLVGGGMSLYERGILRHRITWVREMTRREIEVAGEGEVTVERICTISYLPDEQTKGVVCLKAFQE